MEQKNEFVIESRPIQKELKLKPISAYLAEYKGYYDLLISDLENSPDPFPIRLARFKVELENLKAQFKNERILEFQSKSITLGVSHSCTKGYRGGTKKCGWKFVSPNHPSMYTTTSWFSLSGQAKRTAVHNDGRSAGIYQSKSGKGRISGTLTAIFRFHPDFIATYSEEDVDSLFADIVDEPFFEELRNEGKEFEYRDYKIT